MRAMFVTVGGPTSVCEGLDVKRKVNVDALCILHLLEDDPNKPHGNKVVSVAETQILMVSKRQPVTHDAFLFLQEELDSLIAVVFGPREGLRVDMSQRNVLIPLEVSHEDTDL